MPKKRDGRKRSEKRLALVPTENDKGIVGRDGVCNSLRRDSKTRCRNPAGYRTDHAGFGACAFHGGNSPSLQRHAAKQHIRIFAEEVDMEPDAAIKWAVRMSAGAVTWFQGRIAAAQEGDEDLAFLLAGYADERDRLAKTAKLAVDAGIAERQVQVMEQEAALFAGAIRTIFERLNLNAEQRAKAPEIVRDVMLALPPAG
jgi:hypothetical protein